MTETAFTAFFTASTITSRAYTEAVKNAVNAVKALED